MKTKISLFLWLLCIGILNAQETVTTAGAEASGAGGTLSDTIGQIVYTTNQSSNGSVAQGVHQPFEISVTLGVAITTIQLDLSVYPNPTTNYLTLKVTDSRWNKLHYQLYDVQGRVLKNKKITTKNSTIDMRNIISGAYFLKITQNQQIIKSFKIIKN